MIFFTSDQHFGHENIIKHCHRPFRDADEMDDFMIRQWNDVVVPGDTVFHLGDISHKRCPPGKADCIISKLHGFIHLIAGNHEIDGKGEEFDSMAPWYDRMTLDIGLFESVNPGYMEISEKGKLIVLSHYPLESWHNQRKKGIHLHGHSHGKMNHKTRRLDVGVDTHDFRPWSIDEVFAKLKVGKPTPKQSEMF